MMRLVAFVTNPLSIRGVLSNLGLSIEPPALEMARDPPLMVFGFVWKVYREDIDPLLVCDGPEDPFPESIDEPHLEELYVEQDPDGHKGPLCLEKSPYLSYLLNHMILMSVFSDYVFHLTNFFFGEHFKQRAALAR